MFMHVRIFIPWQDISQFTYLGHQETNPERASILILKTNQKQQVIDIPFGLLKDGITIDAQQVFEELSQTLLKNLSKTL